MGVARMWGSASLASCPLQSIASESVEGVWFVGVARMWGSASLATCPSQSTASESGRRCGLWVWLGCGATQVWHHAHHSQLRVSEGVVQGAVDGCGMGMGVTRIWDSAVLATSHHGPLQVCRGNREGGGNGWEMGGWGSGSLASEYGKCHSGNGRGIGVAGMWYVHVYIIVRVGYLEICRI